MNSDETEYIKKFKQMTYEEVLESFSNLKHIGIGIEQIEISAKAYFNAFHKDHENCYVCNGIKKHIDTSTSSSSSDQARKE